MKGRGGRFVCSAIVLLWGVAWALQRPPPLDPPPARVAIHQAPRRPAPIAESPAPVAEEVEQAAPPQREPEPVEPPAASGVEVVAGAEEVAEGETLLRGGGAFPPLEASYDALGSFALYSQAMRSLGARFVVVRQRRVVGEIDVAGEVLGTEMPSGHFSPRARNYSDEPALTRARRRARERFGSGSSVMMLVPRRLDAALFGSVSRWLASQGESPADYRELEARYAQGSDGSLRLHLEAGTRLDGSRRSFDLVFDLSKAAGQGA